MREWLRQRLDELQAHGLYRDPRDSTARAALERRTAPPLLDACSNDYLGLGSDPVSRETLDSLSGSRVGAGASRLVQGTFPEHEELEAELADWVGAESALVAVSAFTANLGALPALLEPESCVVSDALNHASLVDACRLSKARVQVVPHLDLEAVERALRGRSTAPAWVVTEGLFSMDGDTPDLPALRALCSRYEAGLFLDEAHSLGILGPAGAGAAAESAIRPEVLVGGLGKAVGAQGGFIAGDRELRDWLWNRARSFVFSTAPSPLLSRLALLQVRRARAADAARSRLRDLSERLRSALASRGATFVSSGRGPIVPLLLGSSERALRAMELFRERGILAQAIRPPTVPPGTARLRLVAHADWPDNAIERVVDAAEAACAS